MIKSSKRGKAPVQIFGVRFTRFDSKKHHPYKRVSVMGIKNLAIIRPTDPEWETAEFEVGPIPVNANDNY